MVGREKERPVDARRMTVPMRERKDRAGDEVRPAVAGGVGGGEADIEI